MVEVEVRDFQSIEKAAFQIDGFSVVVGRSNIGKSALVRALKAALTGAPASSFVRHGAACLRRTKKAKTCKCFASVHMVAEGFDLLWEKGDAINRYTFNGAIYDKAERGTPDFLQPDFAPVKVGDRQELLQVADQFSPIFLLDQTGGSVADTLSDVARLDRINAAMRLAEKDRKEASQTRKVREKDVADLRVKLAGYDGLDAALADVQGLADRQVLIEKQERGLERVDGYLAQAASFASVIRELSQVVSVQVSDPAELRAGQKNLDRLDGFIVKHEDRAQDVATLDGVGGLLAPDPTDLRGQAQTLGLLDGWVARLVNMKGWITPWKAVEACPVPTASGLIEAQQRLASLNGMTSKYATLTALATCLDEELETVLTEDRKLTEERAELGVCPTCVRPVSECVGVK